MDVQWDRLSKVEFQKKKGRAQSLVQDPTGLRGQLQSRALEHLTKALHEANDSRVRSSGGVEDVSTSAVINSQLAPSMDQLPVAGSAYIAKRIPVESADRARVALSDLKALKIQVVPWNGM